MAKTPPDRQQAKKLPKKKAIKKKLLLVSAVKQTWRGSLDADEIRVLHVNFRVPASDLLNVGQIVVGNTNGQDGVSILDSHPDDQIRRIDADPNDWP